MADYQTPTTTLEAVNELLRVIGESPVETLDDIDTLVEDASSALQTLYTVSRRVQSRGWHFNTEVNYPLLPNPDGEIILPSNLLRASNIDCDYSNDYVQRGQKLYDRRNHTFEINKNLKASVVLLLDFEDLPEYARNYIMIRAARSFQESSPASTTLSAFTEKEELLAKADLDAAEAQVGGYNILNGSYDTQSIWFRPFGKLG